MFTSPKRYIRNFKGDIVEGGPGISGTLVVAAGAEISEDEAIKLGLLSSKVRPSGPVSQPIDRASGKVAPLLQGNVADIINKGNQESKPQETAPPSPPPPEGDTGQRPWEAPAPPEGLALEGQANEATDHVTKGGETTKEHA